MLCVVTRPYDGSGGFFSKFSQSVIQENYVRVHYPRSDRGGSLLTIRADHISKSQGGLMYDLLDQSTVVSPEPDTTSPHIKAKKHFASGGLALTLALVLITFSLMWLSISAPVALASVSLNPISDGSHLAPLAATLTVTSTADSGPGSLRAALATVSTGDTINFSLAANSTITLTSGELAVNTSVTIDGSTATNLAVDDNNASRVFNVSVPATFIGFTIINGNSGSSNGGGLLTSKAITLTNMTFISNSGYDGGGVYAAGTATLNGVQFLNNLAADWGGGAYVGGAATLNGGLFQDNTTTNVGGGLYAASTLALTSTQFISNTAIGAGGGAYEVGAVRLIGGLFQNNTGDQGGGLYALSTLALTDTQFISNTSTHGGGGVYVNDAATLKGGLFQNNTSTSDYGGGLFALSTLDLTGTQFIRNTSLGGGGAYALAAATLNGGLFRNNISTASGGGLFAFSNLDLTGTQFIGNASGLGGGAYVPFGAATLRGGLFQNNTSTSFGGGLEAEGTLNLIGTQFISNTAVNGGGGIYVSGAWVVNALFARNTANLNGADLYSTGNVAILHATFANPTSGSGAAIYVFNGTLGMTNTIIANHTTGIENNLGTVYADYNLFYGNTTDTSGTIAGGTHDVKGNPNFVDPASDNYHLGIGAAIGRAINVGVNTDRDGNARPGVGGFDIGAYQYTGALFKVYLPLTMKNF
jgi:predicted outer membrane repeat protein